MVDRKYHKIDLFDYKSVPVGEHSIRLLHLPPRFTYSGLLQLKLESVSREEAKRLGYEALSYTWGAQKSTTEKAVLVDGRRFYITQNLYELLHARSSMWVERLVWADAICINQSEAGNDEKITQVQRMNEVYQDATRVIAWLGDEYDAAMGVRMLLRIFDMRKCWAREPAKFQDSFDRHGPEWRAFLKITSHNYFSRAWICQEASLGNNFQFLVAGQFLRPGKMYSATAAILGGEFRSTFFTTRSRHFKSLIRAIQNWHVVYFLRHTEFAEEPGPRYSPRNPISLGLLLSLCARHQAERPVDKIYSLLGISGNKVAMSIKPNYQKGMAEEVFRKTALKLARSKEDALYLLPHAGIGYKRMHSNLPTWVPDWEAESTRQSQILSVYDHPFHRWYGRPLKSNMSSYKFKAAPETDELFTVIDDFKLQAKAIRIDTIKRLTEPYNNYDNDLNCQSDWLYDAESHFTDSSKAGDAFWRTLIMDGTYDQRPVPDPDRWNKIFKSWKRGVGPQAQVNVDSSRIAAINAIVREENYKDIEHGDIRDRPSEIIYGSRFTDCCSGRRFCTTEEKRLPGLAPPETRPGDAVYIIDGLQVPYILRWSGSKNGFELVGECYIHGIMFGEGFHRDHLENLTIV